MKPSEKRTSTVLGLGKVSGEPRHTTKRERVEQDGAPSSVPPISAPPPSGSPSSGAPPGRHTRALESNRPRNTRSIESNPPREHGSKDDVEITPVGARQARESAQPGVGSDRADRADRIDRIDRKPSPPPDVVRSESKPGQQRIERVEMDDDEPAVSSVRGMPSSRTPIEVTQVDTKPTSRSGPHSKASDARFPAEQPTGRRPIAGRGTGDEREEPRTATSAQTKPSGSLTVDGRPIGKRADGGRADSSRPTSSRPGGGRAESARPASGRPLSGPPETGRSASARPTTGRPTTGRPAAQPEGVRPPPRGTPTGPARSARVSIREDNVGAAVNAHAVGAGSRAVPKLLKTKAEIAAAPIDHRAGFLLAHVDGVTTVAGLVDICGMSEDQVDEILDRLRRLGIVAVR
jgi:hypothetical protein